MSSARFALTPGTIADQLRRRLLALDYPAFARCVCALLEALGYEEVRPAGRREWKGYNRHGGGGYDLEATLPGGVTPRRVVAQIKQFDSLHVHQRSVDELRGACLRAGAAEAILVTTSAFSEVVRNQAASPDALGALVVPVRLIDGMELLGLLIRHHLGVREWVQGGLVRLEIDEAFFRDISASQTAGTSQAAGVSDPAAIQRRNSRALLKWRVIIRISSDDAPPSVRQGTRTDRPGDDGLKDNGLRNSGLRNDGLSSGLRSDIFGKGGR